MSWLAVAKKEYLENVRNAWIVTIAVIFLALTLLASGAAAALTSFGREMGFADFVATINSMGNVTGFLLPILALTLGFATLAGERESGSLGLLVAQPVTRFDIAFGKAIGLWGVLATAVVAGAGLGSLVVLTATEAGAGAFSAFLVFMLATLAWGAAWISITMLLSAFFKRRSTAIGGAVGVWFLFSGFVWLLLTFLVVLLVVGNRFEQMMQQQNVELPGWLILTQVLNPNAVYDGLLATSIDGYDTITSTVAKEVLPDAYVPLTFVVAMALWIALPFVGAYHLLRARDI